MLKPQAMLIGVLICSTLAGSAGSQQLTGTIQKQGTVTKVARPSAVRLNGAERQDPVAGKLTDKDFVVKATSGALDPSLTRQLETGVNSTAIDSTIDAAMTPRKGEETATSKSMPAIPTPTIASNKQVIIVRLTYHRLDEQNIFNAIKMCRALRSTGSDVILMLDKEATRIANRNLSTQFISHHESKAHSVPEVLESALTDGVRIVASKDWANDFGVDDSNAVTGIEFLSTDQLAAEIVGSTKILEY